jgi:hypothetical protein
MAFESDLHLVKVAVCHESHPSDVTVLNQST